MKVNQFSDRNSELLQDLSRRGAVLRSDLRRPHINPPLPLLRAAFDSGQHPSLSPAAGQTPLAAAGLLQRSAQSGAAEERWGAKQEAEARAGLHSPPPCGPNMPLRSKTLSGIVVFISSVLLGSCGTDGGERSVCMSEPRGFFVRGGAL